MERYTLIIEEKARKELQRIYASGDKVTIKRLEQIFIELKQNPYIGIGLPERLKYNLNNLYSRRLNKKDRLVYQILESEVIVVVVSAMGHY